MSETGLHHQVRLGVMVNFVDPVEERAHFTIEVRDGRSFEMHPFVPDRAGDDLHLSPHNLR